MTNTAIRNGEHPGPETRELCLASDILYGAEEIADFLYGKKEKRRTVYHLAENASFPHFRLGTFLCARRSTLLTWIKEQEKKARHP